MSGIKCQICGEWFIDKGNHPATCGKRDCAIKASRLGLFEVPMPKPANRGAK